MTPAEIFFRAAGLAGLGLFYLFAGLVFVLVLVAFFLGIADPLGLIAELLA